MPTPTTKKELRILYGISQSTLRRWMRKISGLKADKRSKIVPPGDLERIISHLGAPDEQNAD